MQKESKRVPEVTNPDRQPTGYQQELCRGDYLYVRMRTSRFANDA